MQDNTFQPSSLPPEAQPLFSGSLSALESPAQAEDIRGTEVEAPNEQGNEGNPPQRYMDIAIDASDAGLPISLDLVNKQSSAPLESQPANSAVPYSNPGCNNSNGHISPGVQPANEDETPEGDVPDDEDCESDGDVLADDIQEALTSKAQSFKGSYYHASSLDNAPNPCLHIAGLGLVGLPLSERDAKSIISCATLAPFGRGERTVVDTNVRDTWELEPTSFAFGNPGWANFINETVRQQICKSLGVELGMSPPRLDLYKLLLYERGSHFLPHQDTQKADGMFATVIVVLPSAYTGGQVVVSHASTSKVIDFAPNSMLSSALLAWYTDVKHEVKPITSGYRLALAYNMIHTAPPSIPKPMLPSVDKGTQQLRKILRKWMQGRYSEVPDIPLIAYVLDHSYSGLNLQQGLGALKGADLYRVVSIRDVAEDLGFIIGFAHLSRHDVGTADDSGGYYHKRRHYYDSDSSRENTPDMGEVEETTTTLEDLVDVNGDSPMDDVSEILINDDCLLPKNYFENTSPDETEYEGYMGNGAGSLEHWYHRTALVIMHEKDVDNIYFKAGGASYAIEKLKAAPFPPTDADRTWALRLSKAPESLDVKQATIVIKLALRWKNIEIWSGIMRAPSVTLPAVDETLLIESWRTFSFDVVKQRFEEVLIRSKGVPIQSKFLKRVQAVAKTDDQAEVIAWYKAQVGRLLASYTAAETNDIPSIVGLISEVGTSAFIEKALPSLSKHHNAYVFMIAMVKSLWQARQSIQAAEAQPVAYAHLSGDRTPGASPEVAAILPGAAAPTPTTSDSIVMLIDRCLSTAAAKWSEAIIPKYYWSHTAPASTNTKIDRIVEIVQQAVGVNNLDVCRKLFIDVLKSQGTIRDKINEIFKPVMPRLRPILRAKNLDWFHEPFVDLCQIVIGSCLREFLGKKTVGTDAKMRKIGCGCVDCKRLDEFMVDSKRAQHLFRLVKDRRLHLEQQIATAKDICTFRTINYGSPHGVEVTKRPDLIALTSWDYRLRETRAFLASIGPDDLINKVMGPRYPDVVAALNGVKVFGTVSTGLNPPLDLTVSTSTASASTSNSSGIQAAVATSAVPNAGITVTPLPSGASGTSATQVASNRNAGSCPPRYH